jgi:hypothetical protein
VLQGGAGEAQGSSTGGEIFLESVTRTSVGTAYARLHSASLLDQLLLSQSVVLVCTYSVEYWCHFKLCVSRWCRCVRQYCPWCQLRLPDGLVPCSNLPRVLSPCGVG